MNGIMKIVKSLEEFVLLIKGARHLIYIYIYIYIYIEIFKILGFIENI